MERVKVALKSRPMTHAEQVRDCQVVVEKGAKANQVVINNKYAFSFNFVFDGRESQEQVYNLLVSDMLDKLFSGINASILAYGATGSGKTYTLDTEFDGILHDNIGIIPRALYDIFDRIENQSEEYEFAVKCSFLEIRSMWIYDLLSEEVRNRSCIELSEERNGAFSIPLSSEKEVFSAKQATDYLVKGAMNRATALKMMGCEDYSKSHAIFTVSLQSTRKDGSGVMKTSKFHLVDMAGTERQTNKHIPKMDRRQLNKDFAILRNMISALGDGKYDFVRYSDAQLIRLLQDSLRGNSVALLIACVSPINDNIAETLFTLRYADRIRKIKPIVNQDLRAAEIRRRIIEKILAERQTKSGTLSSPLTNNVSNVVSLVAPNMVTYKQNIMPSEDQNVKYKQLKEKYKNLQQQYQMIILDVTEYELKAQRADALQNKLKQKIEEMKYEFNKVKGSAYGEEIMLEIALNVCRILKVLDEELYIAETEDGNDKWFSTLSSEAKQGETTIAINWKKKMIQEYNEDFTGNQMRFCEELRTINLTLKSKEQARQRFTGNFGKFSTLDMEEKNKEFQDKLRKGKVINLFFHSHEEWLKREGIINQAISQMNRTVNVQYVQSKLPKLRDKEMRKSIYLDNEIESMKKLKVCLIKKLRSATEGFSEHKVEREKQLVYTNNKERKVQNEMEALYNKQRSALKRKCEDAKTINKRWKDAVDKQIVAVTSKDAIAAEIKIDQVITCVKRELETIISRIDAERSLEQLIDDRGIISSRLGELLQQQPPPESNSSSGLKISNLQKEIEKLNTQISDIQQKGSAYDTDAMIRSIGEKVQSYAEARALFNYLLKTLVDMRREHSKLCEVLRSQIRIDEKELNEAAKFIKKITFGHEQMIDEYNERMENALTTEKERRKRQQKKIESLKIQLKNCKLKNSTMNQEQFIFDITGAGKSKQTEKKTQRKTKFCQCRLNCGIYCGCHNSGETCKVKCYCKAFCNNGQMRQDTNPSVANERGNTSFP